MADAALTIVGAGAVGLALGARLARAGVAIELVTRRPEAALALANEGLRAEDPGDGSSFEVAVRAVPSLDEARLDGDAAILLCTRRDDVPALAGWLGTRRISRSVVTFQNDVESERALARHHRHVIGGVWRETCTRLSDRCVSFQLGRPSRAILGRHPTGRDPEVTALAELLELGGIDTGVSECIGEDKWLKLCVNLTSAPNALVRRADHAHAAFVEVKVRLLEEARAVLAAARIQARSCDGRDRSLDEEIEHHRSSLARGTSVRAIPLYNMVWATLQEGRTLESDSYYRRILALAERHGLEAPTNARVLERLLEAHREQRGPECFGAEELLP